MFIDALTILNSRTLFTVLLVVPIYGASFSAGTRSVYTPFNTTSLGSNPVTPLGWACPIRLKLKNLFVVVSANTLNNITRIQVYEEGVATSLYVDIPSGSTGIKFNNTDEIVIDVSNRINILVDTTLATSGSITLDGISVAARLALPEE